MTIISKCKTCGGSVEWEIGDAAGVCKACGAEKIMEKSDVYEQAGLLAEEDTEDSLEQAMLLYRFLRGWQDADQQYVKCQTRLGQIRWQAESARLKEEEMRFEKKAARRKKIGITALVAVLLCITVVTAVTLIQFIQYSRARELFTAGEYERSAAAFLEMQDYRDSKEMLYSSAVELYRAGRYEEALPYFVLLDGAFDHGYYLQKCQERLPARDADDPGRE